ncbi:MAG: hypothetical protein AAGF79_06940 [Pseudomonadota bacterium]
MTAPTTLPWPAVALFLGTMLGAAILAALINPAAAAPAMVGAMAGILGGFLTPKGRAWVPLLTGLVALGVLLFAPSAPLRWLIALLLCAAAGWETARSGGRMMVLVIYAWLAVQLISVMPAEELSVPVTALSLIFGWAVAEAMGLSGRAAGPAGQPLHGVVLTAYLAIGLILSILLMHHIESAFAYWVALIFVMRALAPLNMTARATLSFGIGATLGCLAALAFIALHPPQLLSVALGLVCLVAGFRLIPHPRPYTPAAMSAAVLLLVAQDPQTVLLRLEVSLIVVVVSFGLSTALGLLLEPDKWHRASPGTPPPG